jgi:hypothetical protein
MNGCGTMKLKQRVTFDASSSTATTNWWPNVVASSTGPLHVIGVEAFEYVSYSVEGTTNSGGAILFSQVGKPIVTWSFKTYTTILQSLFELHRNGIVHGNPHVYNIMEVADGSFRWIDFQQDDFCPKMVYMDLFRLFLSILDSSWVPCKLLDKVVLYANTGMDDPDQEVNRKAIIDHLRGLRRSWTIEDDE